MTSSEKVSLVTGGARRIGKAISMCLHKEGFNVVIHCNSSVKEAEELKAQLNQIRQHSAEVVSGDLGKDVADTARRVVEEAVEKWGRLDVVVNNASNIYASTVENITSESWDFSMDVNLKAPVFIMQAAAPFLKKQKGTIVNISDLLGMEATDSHFAHGISKAGLITATLTAARTLGPEVTVNTIAPGYIIWPEANLDGFTEILRQNWLTRTPLKRSGCPEDIAQAVLFLTSPAANFITGQILKVDGGRSLDF